MDRLKVNFLGKEFSNPLVAASGTFGFGREYSEFFDVKEIGGICSKGLTLNPQPGNTGVRIWETPSGVINSIGLENPGVKSFIENELGYMNSTGSRVIVNFGAHSKEDFLDGIELLNEQELDFIELNISCPNVKEGGMAFCMHSASAYDITKSVKEKSKHPIIVKLSPNAPSVTDVAKAVEDGGADAVSLTNTFLAMAIDINKKKPVFDNVYAGLSGSAIKPIALRMVHQVAKEINIPILAYGGVSNYKDALEFVMAGATLVGVGSAIFANPMVMLEIRDDLDKYLKNNNINNISELIGIV
ncbi:dihydroorotate dehydrogenase [Anaerofustis butyriciformans]|uniref:dihydroorotate dehydrogenase n=1 Tax=Anaerofustis butyriciformans TaxID=3108533 RepID=UPI002E353FE2|nr:dihydroorotate dehydrogenase [Anaerofustis sp. HA2171]